MPESQLTISGKSNVNTFQCHSADVMQKGSFMAFEPTTSGTIGFYNASVALKVKSLSCGSKLIEKDLNKSMMSDRFPFIYLDFKDAKLSAKYPNNTSKYLATVKITIANTTKETKVELMLQQLTANTYRLTGTQTLVLKDFNINPPKAMFGLIVVNEEITINFNITASIKKDFFNTTSI